MLLRKNSKPIMFNAINNKKNGAFTSVNLNKFNVVVTDFLFWYFFYLPNKIHYNTPTNFSSSSILSYFVKLLFFDTCKFSSSIVYNSSDRILLERQKLRW